LLIRPELYLILMKVFFFFNQVTNARVYLYEEWFSEKGSKRLLYSIIVCVILRVVNCFVSLKEL